MVIGDDLNLRKVRFEICELKRGKGVGTSRFVEHLQIQAMAGGERLFILDIEF